MILCISSFFVHAEGFKLFNNGGKAATLAGAFTARADDSSAVYYNPAGLAFLTGFQVNPNILYSPFTSSGTGLRPVENHRRG